MLAQSQHTKSMTGRLIEAVRNFHPHRNDRLFSEFLPVGYKMTSLLPKGSKFSSLALNSKILLGTLITFEDDLADHPQYFDWDLLVSIAREPEEVGEVMGHGNSKMTLGRKIREALWDELSNLPAFSRYRELMRFDLEQIASANRFSGLLRLYPGLECVTESRQFGAFNMGMVAAATIDLMSRESEWDLNLSAIREVSYLGQRAARISNVLSTFDRESAEGDLTNEVLIAAQNGEGRSPYIIQIQAERQELVAQIRRIGTRTDSAILQRYATGIEQLHQLHFKLSSII